MQRGVAKAAVTFSPPVDARRVLKILPSSVFGEEKKIDDASSGWNTNGKIRTWKYLLCFSLFM